LSCHLCGRVAHQNVMRFSRLPRASYVSRPSHPVRHKRCNILK
jgi:hypothetical protein